MFRKPVSLSSAHKVSGADRKKLRRALEKQLGPAADEASLDALLPPKAGDLEQAKLAAPLRGIVYTLDGVAVLFDPSGKGDVLVPTAMGLWRAPALLPAVSLKHPAVSQFIVGAAHGRHGHGADVMLPGVATERLPDFSKGDLVCVVVPGNPAPIAVGLAALSAVDMRTAGLAAGKGKAIEVLQAYGDFLWAEAAGKPVPNEGFAETSVGPVGDWDSSGEEEVEAAAGEGGEAAGTLEGADGMPQAEAAGPGSSSGGVEQSVQEGAVAASGTGNSGGDAGTAAAADSVDMEALLEAALLQALHKSVKDGDLPLAGSALWSQHMLPNRPPGSTLDVKKSKHKKISKLLQVYAKAGLISGKEDKAGDFLVTAINRNHELYEGHRPYKVTNTGSGGGGAGSGGNGSDQLIIEELYKPTRELKPIFEAVGASVDALYYTAEVYEVAQAYVKAAKLEEGAPDPRTLLLDVTLCDGLFKGVIKKGELFPTTLPKAQLRERFLGRMQAQLLVQRGAQRAIRKGAPPPVHVSAEKRQGNKRVTRVTGLEAYLVDVEACAAELRSKLACSTSIAELPGKNNPGHEVVCQGAMVDKVAEHLISCYGVPKKVILTKTV